MNNQTVKRYKWCNEVFNNIFLDDDVHPQSEKTKMRRNRWTEKEKKIMKDFFKKNIKNRQAPKKNEVEEFKTQYPNLFKNKGWVIIKAFVYNCYK